MNNEKINSKIKLSNNWSFVILIFVILKFWNIGRSTFRRSKFWPLPFIFGYISSTTWSNTKLGFVRLKVLCIVIFVDAYNYLILFFFSCACHENLLYRHSNFWGREVYF